MSEVIDISPSNLDSSLCFIQPGISGASLVAHMPTQETWVQPLGQEDPLEEETASHSNILVWEIPWTEEPSGFSPCDRRELSTERLNHYYCIGIYLIAWNIF